MLTWLYCARPLPLFLNVSGDISEQLQGYVPHPKSHVASSLHHPAGVIEIVKYNSMIDTAFAYRLAT